MIQPSRASGGSRIASNAAALLCAILLLAACTGTRENGIEVTTPQGQMSVSLNGELPPNWPSDIPVPPGTDPAGSASLVGKSNGIKAGVYRSRQSPEQAYDYYTSQSSITTATKSAVGSGSDFVGRLSITAPITANITIVPYQKGSLVVIVSPGGHGPSTTPTTLPLDSSGRR